MTTRKKLTLGLIALAVAMTTVVGIKTYKDANPQLVGRCFLFNDRGMMVALQIEKETEETYVISASNGFFSVQFEAPKSEVVKSYRDKEIQEVDCQTGEVKDE